MSFNEEFNLPISLFADGDLAKAIFERSGDDILELTETLTLITRHHFPPQRANASGFTFVANSSLSGGRHPCGNPDCRSKKLEELVSFAALYADAVYIQNPFEEIFFRAQDGIKPVDRDELFFGITNYITLAPLIERGLIKYSHKAVYVCKHHFDSISSPLSERISLRNEALAKSIESHLENSCTFTLDTNKHGDQFLKATGPEAFIDHGVTYLHLYEGFSSAELREKYPSLPHQMSIEEIREHGLLSLIVGPILDDLAHQEWHNAFYSTSFLCDNPLQMRLARQANISEGSADSSALLSGFEHHLPTVLSSDTTALMELRDREFESFRVYRDKLRSLLSDSNSWTETEINNAFQDEIIPELNILEKRLHDWKSNLREGIAEKTIIGSGAIAVGLYSGLLPANIGEVFAAAGGGAAAVKTLLDINSTLKPHQRARANDYYFLWKANSGTASNRN